MDWILTGVIAMGAFGIGGALAWLAGGGRAAALKGEIDAARGAKAEAETLRSRNLTLERDLAAAAARAEPLESLNTELARLRARETALESEKAATRAAQERDAAAHAEQIKQLAALRQEVEDQFARLAGNALKANSDAFAKHAEDLFKMQKELTASEIDKRSAALGEIVKPLGDSLKSYDEAIKKIEKERVEGFSEIRTTLQAVSTQAGDVRTATLGLTNALRASPKTRGRWGEETLRRVMELSGMVEHCDFETERHFAGDDAALRPDALISVAGGRAIVVDAKAPVSAYLDAINATSDVERESLLKLHADQLRERLKNLSAKSYWQAIPGSTDCVVMFVPGDNFVAAAFERDPDLFEDGIKARVLICTPTTFIALTKAIAYGWRQEKLAANALEVSRLGKDLYQRLSTMAEHVSAIGKHLENGIGAYNRLVGNLESRVLPQARRFHDLGVEGAAKEIPELEQSNTAARAFASAPPALDVPVET